jgi:hypothetical protein
MEKKRLYFMFLAIILFSFSIVSAVNSEIGSGSLQYLKIDNIALEQNKLIVNYSFDNSEFVGSSVEISIWVANESGSEVKRISDSFPINKEGIINRQVNIDLPRNLAGTYYVYLSLSSDSNNFVRQDFVLGNSKTVGHVIFGENNGKSIGYFIILLLIALIIIFILRLQKCSLILHF